MLQDLGKSNCGLRVSGKEKKVEGRRGKGRTGKSLEDRTGQKRKENRQGCRVWGERGRWVEEGRMERDTEKRRRQWLPQHWAAAPWWLSHGYFGGVNFLPIWGNLAGVLTYLECLRLLQPVIAE